MSIAAQETIQALVARVVEQEASIAALREYVAILTAAEAERKGVEGANIEGARAEILRVTQRSLADYLTKIEDECPALAAVLDKRDSQEVPTD